MVNGRRACHSAVRDHLSVKKKKKDCSLVVYDRKRKEKVDDNPCHRPQRPDKGLSLTFLRNKLVLRLSTKPTHPNSEQLLWQGPWRSQLSSFH